MKPYLEILMNNWEFLAPVIYEIIARLWPTRWNISILDNGWKILNWVIPNLRKKKGNEMMATDKKNLVPVNINKHVLKCLLVLLLSAPLIQANAQIWQNFKGIRLVNESDTAQQLSVQGSLFYDDVIDSLYLYNGTKWINLMRTGGGSGGAFWPLSGDALLTGDVRIFGGNHSLTLGSLTPFSDFNLNAGTGSVKIDNGGSITISVDQSHEGVIISTDGTDTNVVGVGTSSAFIGADNQTIGVQTFINVYNSGDIGIDAPSGIQINGNDLQYLSASNQILLLNTAGTHTTSMFGGEIQLDDPGGNLNLALNNQGLTSSGATDFVVQSDQDLNLNAENNLEIVSRTDGNVTLGDNVSNGDSVKIAGRIKIAPFNPILSDLFAGVTTLTVSGSDNVSSETDCNNCHYTRVISSITVDGTFTVTPTAGNVQTTLAMTLPLLEGSFSDTFDAIGTFTAFDSTSGTFVPGTIWAVGNGVVFNFKPTTTNVHQIYFHLQYEWQN